MIQRNKRLGFAAMCRKTAWVTAALMMGMLVLGGVQDAQATLNPPDCSDTGPALLIRILDPNGTPVPQGTSFYEGTSISYVARLVHTGFPQCAYEGGSLCIETPQGTSCVDVTPGGGVPLLCLDPLECNPDGVTQVLSTPKPYVVNRSDIASTDCADLNSIRARARYQNGISYGDPDPNEVVFPINADTPACIVAMFCGDGIQNGDEECDDGNTNNNDMCRNNCTIPVCGDDIVDPQKNETCDPPGSPAGGAGNLCRDDCTVCGDEVIDEGEECDDGNMVNTDGCRNDCTLPFCGDGILDPNEECDDGNMVNTDGCRNDCTLPFCGDSIVDPNETCDPPGAPAGANDNLCREDCHVCGDGIPNGDEECDDGNSNDNDSCRNDCTMPMCGDGIVDPPETCDPPGAPAGANDNLCRDDCRVCGDGIVNGDEECDDGNTNNNDACRNNCMEPRCGDEILDSNETCDPPGSPAGGNGNLCRDDCYVCGDGMVNGDEECDDGNGVDNDLCRNDCTMPVCDDGIIDPQIGETCDPPGDPAGENGNLCRDDCTVCGDGVVDTGEDCDDGNGIDDDMCSNDCTRPVSEEICRTPGFWGTHAGTEKTRSQNITQALIDYAGGFVICGENITTTDVDDAASAVEAICMHTKGVIERQLARQLTAAALNCIISGGGDDCSGSPLYSEVFGPCNMTCADKNSGMDVPRSEMTACIAAIDCLNNGGEFHDGLCDGNSGCHDRQLYNEALGFDFVPPGPAGSSGACQDANKSACGVLAVDEGECSVDSAP